MTCCRQHTRSWRIHQIRLDRLLGGAFYVFGGNLDVTNSTIAHNSASDGGALYVEGGLGSEKATPIINVSNSTMFANLGVDSGGISLAYDGVDPDTGEIAVEKPRFNLTNSIVASSTAADCDGVLMVNMNNLIEDGTCSPAYSGDPMLSPLGNHSGSTQTFALLPGSPAIDAGDNASCTAVDQRGVARPIGLACDIGAYEREEKQPDYQLSVSVAGSGTVSSSPAGIDCGTNCSEMFEYGTVVALTATPANGWTFVDWGGACSGTGACVATIDGVESVTATFALAPTAASTNTPTATATATSEPTSTPQSAIYKVYLPLVLGSATAPNTGASLALPSVTANIDTPTASNTPTATAMETATPTATVTLTAPSMPTATATPTSTPATDEAATPTAINTVTATSQPTTERATSEPTSTPQPPVSEMYPPLIPGSTAP
jgi:hypothetical protein